MARADVTLERYDLVEKIASGGMGEVFRAVAYGAHGFSKDLAVKRILPRFAQDPEFERRFVAEAKLAAGLTHANIVSVLDFGHMSGSLYLAMEYIDGVDLTALLDGFEAAKKQVPLGAILHIASEVCKGLDFAHRRSVVHRDISPSNLLLSQAGEVKIADFGIARAVTGGTSQIEASRIVGKLRYMSPEQILGQKSGAASDIFALGIVLWELTCCEQLITARDLDEATKQVCEMPIPRVRERRPELPQAFDDAIASMLERDRGKRAGSARDLLRAFTKCAYAVDPVPTAVDVADAVELALGASPQSDVGELDDAILAELGGFAAAEPSRVTKAREARTITLFRGVDAKGIPQLNTAAPSATIDVAATARQSEAPAPSRFGVLGIAAIAAAFALVAGGAVYLGLLSGDSDPALATETLDAAATETPTQVVIDASTPAPVVFDAAVALTTLEVTTKPSGAEVLANGKPIGTSPIKTEHAAGLVELTIRKEGYKDASVAVELEADTPAVVSKRLTRAEGTISVFSHPWANVYYRGKKVGETPIRRLKLPVGSHRLILKNPVLKKSKSIRVKVPRKTPYQVKL